MLGRRVGRAFAAADAERSVEMTRMGKTTARDALAQVAIALAVTWLSSSEARAESIHLGRLLPDDVVVIGNVERTKARLAEVRRLQLVLRATLPAAQAENPASPWSPRNRRLRGVIRHLHQV